MKVYLAIKYHENHQNREWIQAISTALAQNHIETICIARDVEAWGQIHLPPTELMRRSFAEMDDSDLVVVELTEKGVGVGIEAGYASARGIPIITIARTGSDISTTLQGISQQVFLYENFDELAQFFNQTKVEQLLADMKILVQKVAANWTSPHNGLESIEEQRAE